LPVVEHRIAYVIAILCGTLVTALCITFLKSLSKSTNDQGKEAE